MPKPPTVVAIMFKIPNPVDLYRKLTILHAIGVKLASTDDLVNPYNIKRTMDMYKIEV